MSLALEGTPVHLAADTGGGPTYAFSSFSTTQAAQLFVVIVKNGGTVTGVSGGGLTWTQRVASSGSNDIQEWTAQASSAVSAITVTISASGSPTYMTAELFAFSGQDTGTIFDSNAAVPANSLSDPISISTSNANDVIIASFRSSSQPTPTAGSGFTLIVGADFMCVEYMIVSSTQSSLSCGMTVGNATGNGSVADALMASSGPDVIEADIYNGSGPTRTLAESGVGWGLDDAITATTALNPPASTGTKFTWAKTYALYVTTQGTSRSITNRTIRLASAPPTGMHVWWRNDGNTYNQSTAPADTDAGTDGATPSGYSGGAGVGGEVTTTDTIYDATSATNTVGRNGAFVRVAIGIDSTYTGTPNTADPVPQILLGYPHP